MLARVMVVMLCGITECLAGVGTITDLVNTPSSIQRQKTTISGTKGTSIEMLDTIRTQQGKTGITFEDDTKVQVNENSKLVIDDFIYDPNKKTGKLAVKVALAEPELIIGKFEPNTTCFKLMQSKAPE